MILRMGHRWFVRVATDYITYRVLAGESDLRDVGDVHALASRGTIWLIARSPPP
jgi:hypothetical protein